MKYDPQKIESKWQKTWEAKKTYQAKEDEKKKKYYCLIEFPYPSGEGLHVGHVRSNTAMDIIARKRRMEGFNVLYPIGWDAFGLPTENYAIKTGIHPTIVTKKNTDNFRKQLKSLGFSFDWSREVNTTDPEYYKWTQWIFLQFFKAGLAYKAKTTVNWCPKDKTGLANEEVIGGKCERCGTEVVKREKEQWMLKITAYADKLLEGLKDLDFLPEIKTQQQNWIGRSEGALIDFPTSKKYKIVILHGFQGSPKEKHYIWLKEELEKYGHEVVMPELPDTKEPKEGEQVQAALDAVEYDENTILYGHSLGSVVAMKVLEKLQKPIAGLVMSGAFIDPDFLDKDRSFENTFQWKFDAQKIKRNTGFIKLIHDITDTAISINQCSRLEKFLGLQAEKVKAELPHFDADKEPELLKALLPAIRVFTTRPDTLFGATFIAISAELANKWMNVGWQASEKIKKFTREILDDRAEQKTGLPPEALAKEGLDTGLKAVNPANKEEIPVWVVNYVLGDVGTGAIMAVPAHDDRDFEFARKYELPIHYVVAPKNTSVSRSGAGVHWMSDQRVYLGEGKLYDSGQFSGLDSEKAKWEITKFVGGEKTVKYKLRDWVFSRQRYWGEPIPIIHCEKCGYVPVPEKELPLKLPEIKNYEPRDDGESPLASIEKWVNVKCPNCKSPAKRETDTMPNWAGSSWYFYRYTDPKNKKEFASADALQYWLPVDWYNGGMEHVTLHLLYSRFWNLFLYDKKLVPTKEPYKKRTAHGLILAEGGVKMSKSKGNVVNPDTLVKEFGADALRLYEMFIGPFNQAVAWDPRGIIGMSRFLEKIWTIANEKKIEKKSADTLERALNKTVKKVTEDIETMSFNTAVSTMMIFVNQAYPEKEISLSIWEKFLTVLNPFAPHIASELWQMLGNKTILDTEPWPTWDESSLEEEVVELVIQIDGKLRDRIKVEKGTNETKAKEKALAEPTIQKWLEGKTIKKTIFVPDRLINILLNE